MKNKLLIFILVILAPFISVAQSATDAIDKFVREIKANISKLKKVEKVNSAQGARYVYLKDNDLKVITVKANEGGMEKNVAWYYIAGQLAYCETNWMDSQTGATVFNERCYLNNGHLIAWTNTRENTIDPSSEEFKKLDKDLVAYGIKLKEEAVK